MKASFSGEKRPAAVATATVLSGIIALAACGKPPAPPQQTDDDQTPVVQPRESEYAEPADPRFIGRVWVSNQPGSPRGSILVFLPDRTLLMDSCFETFRLSRWGIAGNHIRWLEDTIPIEAEVSLPNKNELRLQIAGQERVQTYIAASVPYVCPDLPR